MHVAWTCGPATALNLYRPLYPITLFYTMVIILFYCLLMPGVNEEDDDNLSIVI